MKSFLLSLLTLASFSNASSQTNINLTLNHEWNGETFQYGQLYTDEQGRKVEITRVQYYLSGISLTHDAGQTTDLTSTYVLASANISEYSLGSADVSSVEGISFDLGVDQATNHLDPSQYADNHPLALQSPSMHWGWSAGYRFVVIEGNIDSDGDNQVDKLFQFHVTGDNNYLVNVDPLTISSSESNSELDIELYVNIADWVNGIDLVSAGLNHGVRTINGDLMNNTNTNTVFSTEQGVVSVNDVKLAQNNVSFNYSTPYAPTIFYQFSEEDLINLSVFDLNGREVITAKSLTNEGNYFINTELSAGTYIAVFSNNEQSLITEKFVVTQ